MKQPIALCPSLLCDARLWEHQAEHLAGIADCYIGDFTSQDNVAAMARSVLAAMPEKFAIAGLSMGGYVAMEAIRQAPERITRLCLLDTSARADTEQQTAFRRQMLEQVQLGQFKGVTQRMLPLFLHPARLEDKSLTGAIMDMAAAVGRDAYVRQQTAIMNRIDSRPSLGAIKCPVLVICGRQDTLTPVAMSEEIIQSIPGAKLEIVEDCGHMSAMERPEQVTALMRRWLETPA